SAVVTPVAMTRASPRRSGPSATPMTTPSWRASTGWGHRPRLCRGGVKTECIRTTVFHGGPFRTLTDVEFATAGWVGRDNNRRLHGSLGMITPVEFETLHYEALTREPAPTK